MRKKQGSSYTLYLPQHLVAEAKLVADQRDKTTSQITAIALKEYLNRLKNSNAPLR